MFGEWQDFFRTSVSSGGVCAAKVGHSLLSSVCTLLLLLSLSVQQSFSAWTAMLRFATKELCGCQIAFSYGHQTQSSIWVNSVCKSMGVQKTILCPVGKPDSTCDPLQTAYSSSQPLFHLPCQSYILYGQMNTNKVWQLGKWLLSSHAQMRLARPLSDKRVRLRIYM